jgi:hypothetical protein
MNLNDMAPAIGGATFGIVMWLYALRIRRQARAARRFHHTPAE